MLLNRLAKSHKIGRKVVFPGRFIEFFPEIFLNGDEIDDSSCESGDAQAHGYNIKIQSVLFVKNRVMVSKSFFD